MTIFNYEMQLRLMIELFESKMALSDLFLTSKRLFRSILPK